MRPAIQLEAAARGPFTVNALWPDNTAATVFDNTVVVGDATTTWLTNAAPVFVRKAVSASP